VSDAFIPRVDTFIPSVVVVAFFFALRTASLSRVISIVILYFAKAFHNLRGMSRCYYIIQVIISRDMFFCLIISDVALLYTSSLNVTCSVKTSNISGRIGVLQCVLLTIICFVCFSTILTSFFYIVSKTILLISNTI